MRDMMFYKIAIIFLILANVEYWIFEDPYAVVAFAVCAWVSIVAGYFEQLFKN